ncbi:hypothetical protein EBB07_02765 [Paenibacillaceae bacterium]|nr:hypothetical protein EBB07_02765 [Paenibacillaceae bacterium]
MKTFKITFLVLLVFSLVSNIVYATEGSKNEFEAKELLNEVTEKQAEIVASNFALIGSWDYNNIKLVEIFYDTDQTKLGYYFEFYNNDKFVMHVVVSATLNRDPILQFAAGKLELNKLEGATAYYVGTSITYEKNALELKSNLSSESKNTSSSVLKTLPRNNSINYTSWNYYLNTQTNLAPLAIVEEKELPLTRIWQRTTGITNPKTACGPTTGAMIVNYYKSRGYNVRGSTYYGGNAGLVNSLYSKMNTGIFGTTLPKFAVGLFEHLELDDSITTWTGLSYTHPNSSLHFNTFKTYIDSNRPSAVRYDYFVDSESYINYHFMAANGYRVDSDGSKYFGFKDPDNGETTTFTIWRNWTVQAPNFAIHLTHAS